MYLTVKNPRLLIKSRDYVLKENDRREVYAALNDETTRFQNQGGIFCFSERRDQIITF